MNHLESTFAGKNSFWRYIVMIAVVLIVSNTIGALPLLVGMVIKSASNPDVFSQLAANPNDYSVLGLDPNTLLILMLFPFIAGLAAFILFVKPLNNRTLKNTINGTGKIRWNRFFVSAFVWLILSAVYLLLYLKLEPANFTLNNNSASLIFLSVISLLLIPFQAAFEEVLFRGYLMQGFATIIRKRWFPLVTTSVLFGLMHAFNPEVKEYGFLTMMPQYFIFGLIFGAITILDDGIEAAIGAHTANNIFLCIMVTNKSSALQTPALYEQHNIYPWPEFAGLLITGIIFVMILKIIFKWDDYSLIFKKIPV
ncbi:MAG: CPBP family intramembrane metalloprotease [Bacteroidia bacterium]|nr:CPBP family intramembrane metalloprotease [Bacteroidia bacterium]